jgi:hypothetical protein
VLGHLAAAVYKSSGDLRSAHVHANHPAGIFARVHHQKIFTLTFS